VSLLNLVIFEKVLGCESIQISISLVKVTTFFNQFTGTVWISTSLEDFAFHQIQFNASWGVFNAFIDEF
jgi:hypothetical protein